MRRALPLIALLLLAACGEPPTGPPDGGDPCTDRICAGGRVCDPSSEGSCVCPPGTHEEGDACAPDTTCLPETCGERGVCEIGDDGPICACALGWAGAFCDECDAARGYLRSPSGECVTDPCTPSPCTDDPERTRCVVEDGAARCECNARTHDEGGVCVPDTECLPTSCGGHGECIEEGPVVRCECDEGWSGGSCDACDESLGYHDDGAGGCTTDPCLPNPCTAPRQTVCVTEGGDVRCECDAETHLEGELCVPDETCEADTCSGRGACSVVDGRARCACDTGTAGPACESCEVGYHDDGAGGCTMDPCTPNPCADPGQTVCVPAGTAYSCHCDAGYHPDGSGGCTNDPCTPSPCAAMGQACRVVDDVAECFTPVCDDGNPCTEDRVVGGACEHVVVADGTACSTGPCRRDQTCTAGACGGGSDVTCDDLNPCTRDSCDPTSGCVNVSDDSLVPDDGVVCTVDACSGGIASNAASHAMCDDGRYCTGVEECVPGASGADARGCVTRDVPSPPVGDTACGAYVCDDASMSFTFVPLPAGASCDDGLPCTTGDACTASGACAGTLSASCGTLVGSCSSTLPFGGVDVPTARVVGALTLGSGPIPAANNNDSFDATIYLVAKDTGARHVLSRVRYRWSSGAGAYQLIAGDGGIDLRLVPGVYDVLYTRGGTESISPAPAGDPFVNGYRILRRDVVIGPGTNALDVDIPTARITGALTLGSAPIPVTNNNDSFDATLYLVAEDTGARHVLGRVRYRWSSGAGTYQLVAGDGTIDLGLVPGTYDVLYIRGGTTSISPAPGGDPFVNGHRYLMRGVVIGGGASTLDVDIPTARVTGDVTLGSAPIPGVNNNDSYDATVYLVAQDTAARHVLSRARYRWSSGAGAYQLIAGDGTIDLGLVPGRYDVLYIRGGTDSVSPSPSGDPFVNGHRYLMRDVVIGGGASDLDVDVPTAHVTGAITLAGAALPATNNNDSYDATVYLVAEDTGARHVLGRARYRWSSGAGAYQLIAGDGAIDLRLVPGTYHVLYVRGGTTSISPSPTGDPFVNGYRYLSREVAIGGGASTFGVDIPTARVTGAVTIAGEAVPPQNNNDSFDTTVYLVARDTDARHVLARVRYRWSSGAGAYQLIAGDGAIDLRLVPGRYDVLYVRGGTDSISETPAGDPMVNGHRYVARDVVIGAGTSSLNVDVPVTRVTGAMTLAGASLPATNNNDSYDATVYFVAGDTEARHVLTRARYRWASPSYRLIAGDGAYDLRLVPGTYHVLYARGGTTSISPSPLGDPFVNGYRYLGQCLAVP